MTWTDEELAALPVRDGVRLRGLDMTRLETFCDAAFAFAVTLLVIAGDGIPRSVDELLVVLKGVPAFVMSFAAIASFWWAHRQWSRRYGLEDGITTLLSLGLIVVMLIYVYPLKMMFSAFAAWVSGGFLPTEFSLAPSGRSAARSLTLLFGVYGVGFAAQTGMIMALYWRALRASSLRLDAVERVRTRQELAMHGVMAVTGLASAIFALATPLAAGVWAGFFYTTLPITMPLMAVRYSRLAAREAARRATASADGS